MNRFKTKTPIDWSALQNALIVLSVSLVISILLIVGSQQYEKQMKTWQRQQLNKYRAKDAEYARFQETLKIVNGLYFETFMQLVAKGFFLNEPTTNVEGQRSKMLKQIKTLLPQLKTLIAAHSNYTFLEKRPYNYYDTATLEPNFKTYETKLILNLSFLHEGGILKLVQTIGFQKFSGLLKLQSCDITRVNEKIDVKNVKQGNLKANCILVWYISEIEEEE